jgi:hypothetical protein
MGGAVLGNLEIDGQTGTPIPCRPSGHDVWLRGLHGVQGQVRVGEGATSSHLRGDPDRLHDLLGSVALADVQLGVALDAVWALGDVRDGYRDELLGLLGQRRYMSSTELRCSQCAVRQLHHVRRQRLTLRIRILPGTRWALGLGVLCRLLAVDHCRDQLDEIFPWHGPQIVKPSERSPKVDAHDRCHGHRSA